MKLVEYGCIYVLLSVIKGQRRNIAQNKPAYQSSFYGSYGDVTEDASKAVDGDINANFEGGSCSHTALYERNSWWEVDLQSKYAIKEVIVYNREGFESRLGNYTLSGGVPCNDTSTSKCYTECYHHQTAELVQYLTITNCTARYTRITTLLHHPLTLCEVQIFGDLQPVIRGQRRNIAQDKPAYQSSRYVTSVGFPGDASKAVDGDINTKFVDGSCSHTILNESTSWWEVDLQLQYAIKEVIVYNREGFESRLGNYTLSGGVPCNDTSTSKCYTECYHHQTAELVQYLEITNCTARYIRITTLHYDGLTLCEVQIFGDLQQDLTSASVTETTVPTTEAITPTISTKLITSSGSASATEATVSTTEVITPTISTKLITPSGSASVTETTVPTTEAITPTISTKLITSSGSASATEATVSTTDVITPTISTKLITSSGSASVTETTVPTTEAITPTISTKLITSSGSASATEATVSTTEVITPTISTKLITSSGSASVTEITVSTTEVITPTISTKLIISSGFASVTGTTVSTTEVVTPTVSTKLITSPGSNTAKGTEVVSPTIFVKSSNLTVSEAPTTIDTRESTTANGTDVASARGAIVFSLFYLLVVLLCLI